MTKYIALLGIPIFFITTNIFLPSVHAENTVYISELNYNGSSVNGGDKWVELYNPTPNTINLTGWKLIMPNSSKTGVVDLAGSISSGSTFVASVKNSKFVSILPIKADILDYNVTNISNTQANEPNYINVQLVSNTGVVASQIQKNDTQVKSFGTNTKGSTKHSIECDMQGICRLSDKLYGNTGIDYGTPGLVVLPSASSNSKPVENINSVPVTPNVQSAATSSPLTSQIKQIAEPIKANIPDLSREASSPQPVSKTQDITNPTATPYLPVSQNLQSLSFTFSSPSIGTIILPNLSIGNISSASVKTPFRSNIWTEGQLFSLVILTLRAIPVSFKKRVSA